MENNIWLIEPETQEALKKGTLPSWRLRNAEKYGVFHPGWSVIDYIRASIDSRGWENLAIWGKKGGGKSNRLLWLAYQVYKDWDIALEHIVFTPDELTKWFEKALKMREEGRPDESYRDKSDKIIETTRIPLIGFDDMNAQLPRSLYSTNRRAWEGLARAWEVNRALMSVFVSSSPSKATIASFIINDITMDLHVYARYQKGTYNAYADLSKWRSAYDARIWFLDVSVKDVRTEVKLPILIEENVEFRIDEVPLWIWQKYEARKLEIIEASVKQWNEAINNYAGENRRKYGSHRDINENDDIDYDAET